ncbi:HAD family hydrolase [uncultured Tolumonas sp.]|uniref:HAD family hydrolase n=1 Tax=uncultured Tolumonas sp. TaxID=263765 RepID=UPI00292F29E6|nr:HAD family hydrolase [uncultured Tolumonas sp.]
MNRIKLIAIDIDGVVLKDTYSPVLKKVIEKYNGIYTRELERNAFSRNRKEAATYIAKALNLKLTPTQLISEYFQERERYMATHESGIETGAIDFLTAIQKLDTDILFYGGLSESELHHDIKPCMQYVNEYVCTNDFRPGINEIANMYGVRPSSVLFIDDVAFFAENAKKENALFIGVPSHFPFSYQKEEMHHLGVEYMVDSISSISVEMIHAIDNHGKCFRNTL